MNTTLEIKKNKQTIYMKKLFRFLLIALITFVATPQNVQAQCTPTASGAECEGNPIQFFGNPAASNHNWTFDALGTSTQVSPSFVFNTPGTYKITYECTINGVPCKGTLTITIKARPKINVKLLNQFQQCFEGNSMCFVDSSKSGQVGGCIKKIVYLFNDADRIEVLNPTFPRTFCKTYLNPLGGNVELTVEVEDCNGCISKTTYPAIGFIFAKMDVKFSSNKPIKCDSAKVTVTNLTGIKLSDIDSFAWDWGDGTFDINKNWNNPVYHTYKKAGTFNGKLFVKSKFGCKESFTFNSTAVVYKAEGIILANRDSSCNSDPCFDFRLKDGPIAGATSFLWNFGDDPMDQQNYNDKTWSPTRCFTTGPRAFLVKLDYKHPVCGNRTIYDTVLTIGPVSTIEIPPQGILIKENHRYQCVIRDTVQFTNASTFYHNDKNMSDDDSTFKKNWGDDRLGHKWWVNPFDQFKGNAMPNQKRLRYYAERLWNFGDDYAAKCTTDVVKNRNVGINCQYSMDTLPKHWYTPWDDVYFDDASIRPATLSVFYDVDRRCTTKRVWASDSNYIIEDTIALLPNQADSITKGTTGTWSGFSKHVYPDHIVNGPGERYFTYPGWIYLNAGDSAYVSGFDYSNQVLHTGPKRIQLNYKDLVVLKSKTDKFTYILDTFVKRDTVAKDFILEQIAKNKKFHIVGKFKQNVPPGDTVSYSIHYRKFYEKTVKCYTVRLKHTDTFHPLRCESEATVQLALRPPSAKRMRKESIECFGSINPQYGITFILTDTKPGCTQNWTEINYDSFCGRNNWVKMVGGLFPGNRPQAPMPVMPYAISGQFPTRFSKTYTSSMVCAKDGCITVGLIVGNGFKPGVPPPNNKPECIDTIWYNKFACFPLQDPNFKIITPLKQANGAYKACRNDQIIYQLSDNNKTNAYDVENISWSLYTGNAGPNFDKYYRLAVNDLYKRYVYKPGTNNKELMNYLIRTKTIIAPGGTSEVILSKDSIVTAEIYEWDTIADFTKAFDQIKKEVDKLGFDIYELSGSTVYKMIWNKKGSIGNPATGSRGCIDTTGYGSLIVFKVQPRPGKSKILNFRDTSIRPFDSAFFGGKWIQNVVEFRPQYAGYYILELAMSGKGCVQQKGERMTVGFYNKVTLSDSIICNKSPITASTEFRYFSIFPEIDGLKDPVDWWKNRQGQAGQKNREGFVRWDWSKADDNIAQPLTIFGGFPYGATGLGPISIGTGIPGALYYSNPGIYTLRVTTADSFGCKDTIPKTIYVTKVIADFALDVNRPYCKTIIKFNDSAKVIDPCLPGRQCDRIIEWWIDWGDGKKQAFFRESAGGYPNSVGHDYTRNGTFTITYAVKTYLGCKDTIKKQIVISGPIPAFDTANLGRRNICINDSLQFDNESIFPSPASQWFWDFGDGTVPLSIKSKSSVSHTFKKAGTFNIFLRQFDSISGTGKYCDAVYPDTTDGGQAIYTITVHPVREVNAIANPLRICPGDSISLISRSDTGYETFNWKFNNPSDVVSTTDTLLRYRLISPGTHQIILNPDLKGFITPKCASADTVTVYVDSIKADFDIDSTKGPLMCFKNTSINGVTYQWGFKQLSDIRKTGEPFTENSTSTDQIVCNKQDTGCFWIVLIAKSSAGCIDTQAKPLCYYNRTKIQPPNVFTPQKVTDGFNDVFDIPISGHVKYDLSIFDKWGVKVFESEDDKVDWNGKVKNTGAPCTEGTYYWVLKYKFKGDDKDTKIGGVVMLLR